MKPFRVIGVAAAAAMLGGCGGRADSQLAPSGPPPESSAQMPLGQLSAGLANADKSGVAQTGMLEMHPDHGRSWMTPSATTKDLLYISNISANTVAVYSYQQGKLVGTLTGFAQPDGLCNDKKGDIWIANNQGDQGTRNVSNVAKVFQSSKDITPSQKAVFEGD